MRCWDSRKVGASGQSEFGDAVGGEVRQARESDGSAASGDLSFTAREIRSLCWVSGRGGDLVWLGL